MCFLKRKCKHIFTNIFLIKEFLSFVNILEKNIEENQKTVTEKNLLLFSYFLQIFRFYKIGEQTLYKHFVLYFKAVDKHQILDIV